MWISTLKSKYPILPCAHWATLLVGRILIKMNIKQKKSLWTIQHISIHWALVSSTKRRELKVTPLVVILLSSQNEPWVRCYFYEKEGVQRYVTPLTDMNQWSRRIPLWPGSNFLLAWALHGSRLLSRQQLEDWRLITRKVCHKLALWTFSRWQKRRTLR